MDDRREYNPSFQPPGRESRQQPSGSPPSATETRDASASTAPFSVEVRERGASKDGADQLLDRRMFFQLLVFRSAQEPTTLAQRLASALEDAHVPAVIYDDVNDPSSAGVLTFSEDPTHFVAAVRPCLASGLASEAGWAIRPEMTMLGRTYASGHEQDLGYWLIDKPRNTVLEEKWPWAIWYPLRRTGAFAQLAPREQGKILKEHAIIGRAYAGKDLAHDVRLACHGIDAHDNEFVIGLIGKELHPLSHVVQTMRKTRQTSEYIAKMGPFFVGRVAARVRE